MKQKWHSSKPLGIHQSLYYLYYIYIEHYNLTQEGWAFFHPWTPMFIKHNRKSGRFRVAWIMEMSSHIWTKEDGLRIRVNMITSQRFHKVTQANTYIIYKYLHKQTTIVGWHHVEAAIISCEVNCSIPVLGGVSALHCHAWKNAKPISTALVQLLNSCWFEGPMARWSSTCNQGKDAVGSFYPWMVCIIPMKFEMIYETAQTSFKKTHLEGRYCIQYDNYIMVPCLDTYWVIWWTLFWYQYISDHTSKSSNMGNLRLQYLPCETSQKLRNGNNNIEYASNKQTIKLQKDVQ